MLTSEHGANKNRAVSCEGRMFVLAPSFRGDIIKTVKYPSLKTPDTLANYCVDSGNSVFRVSIYDHEGEPHSIYYNSELLTDSNIYIVTTMHQYFLLIAFYFHECPAGDQFVDIFKTFKLDLQCDLGDIFDGDLAAGVYKLSVERCFAIFGTLISRISENFSARCDTFNIRWSLTESSDAEKSLRATGMEILYDCIPPQLFFEFCKHINMIPLSDAQIYKKTSDKNKDCDTPLRRKGIKKPFAVSNSVITQFFKPKQ